MQLAEKFRLPGHHLHRHARRLPGHRRRGARPGRGHRRQPARPWPRSRCPIVAVVIGEGGSGGALGIGVGDRVLMLEHAIYSVISPEGCAAIVWKDQAAVERGRREPRHPGLTSSWSCGIIDKIIPSRPAGAHVDPEQTFKNVDKYLYQALKRLEGKPVGRAPRRALQAHPQDRGLRGTS
ncbi:MAG: hypothetical protein MZV49_00020 [Rhodopseudomonas palustris]|nr:hypothetical protein [Rhodopseudomonas palustris]